MSEGDFAHIIILCEDAKQAKFARELVFAMGLVKREQRRRLRELVCSAGAMSGEQFVRENYPTEVLAHRQRHALAALLVMTDADRFSVIERLKTFDLALQAVTAVPRQPQEQIALLIPKWHIETWLRWLTTQALTSEETPYRKTDYPINLGREAAQRMLTVCRNPPPDLLPSMATGCLEVSRLHNRR